ncbi:MAG: hypothetical protein ACXW0Q_12170 [Methylovulum sp.]
MSNQNENEHNDQPLSTTDLDSITEGSTNPIKALLIGIAGLALILSIFALLPMFFTYLSEGDPRAPSEIHPTDTASKSGQNNYDLAKPEK